VVEGEEDVEVVEGEEGEEEVEGEEGEEEVKGEEGEEEVEGEEYEEEDEDDEYLKRRKELAKTTTAVYLESMSEIFVDELSAQNFVNLDDMFRDEYYNETFDLFILEKMMTVLKKPSQGKIDMGSFAERCEFLIDRMGDFIEVNGSDAAEELARTLEKNGIIKTKGNIIKWKR